MTIYGLLRRLVERSSLSETERNDGLRILETAEKFNIFGTMALEINVQGHECVIASNWYEGSARHHEQCADVRPVRQDLFRAGGWMGELLRIAEPPR